MEQKTKGWVFVGVQIALLIALILVPRGDAWATPPWLLTIAAGLAAIGVVIIVLAALRLGQALTASPVPKPAATLEMRGPYRYVRHPIYSGLLLLVAGITLRAASLITLSLGLAIVAFFNVKARWEEARLLARFDDYARYAAATPRFIPRGGAQPSDQW